MRQFGFTVKVNTMTYSVNVQLDDDKNVYFKQLNLFFDIIPSLILLLEKRFVN